MKKGQRYLDGVILCEQMLEQGYSVQECYNYLNDESGISDYRWSDFWKGFHDCLVFKIKNSVVKNVD